MIRFVFRWAFRLLLLAIVLVIGLLLLKDSIARSFVEREIRRRTGFDARIGALQFGLLEPRINIQNLVLYNPPEFGGSPLFDAPDIQVEYSPAEAVRRVIHLRFLRLSIRELNIVESKGRTNLLEVLHRVSTVPDEKTAGRPSERAPFSGVDLLNLSVAKIRFTDLDRSKRDQDINLALENRLLRNVRSGDEIASVILKELFRTGFVIYTDERPRKRPPK